MPIPLHFRLSPPGRGRTAIAVRVRGADPRPLAGEGGCASSRVRERAFADLWSLDNSTLCVPLTLTLSPGGRGDFGRFAE
jgi:hypothetical protein